MPEHQEYWPQEDALKTEYRELILETLPGTQNEKWEE